LGAGSWGRAVGQKDNVERVGDGARPSQMPYNSIYDTLATFEINLPPLNLLARVQGLKRRWRAVGQKTTWNGADMARDRRNASNSVLDTSATFERSLPRLSLRVSVQGLKRRWRAVGQKTTWNAADMARDQQRCLIIACMTRLPRLEEVCHL